MRRTFDNQHELWFCTAHNSTANSVLDPPEKLNMWAGCHDSLWAFASGKGDRGKQEEVGRCNLVKARISYHA
jgi:hypothetical protein